MKGGLGKNGKDRLSRLSPTHFRSMVLCLELLITQKCRELIKNLRAPVYSYVEIGECEGRCPRRPEEGIRCPEAGVWAVGFEC